MLRAERKCNVEGKKTRQHTHIDRESQVISQCFPYTNLRVWWVGMVWVSLYKYHCHGRADMPYVRWGEQKK